MTEKPSVLFVCVKNGGKSQIAAGLMRQAAGETFKVFSAGTSPGDKVNEMSARSLLEVGIDITGEKPRQLTDEMVRGVDLVVVLGRDAQVDPTVGIPVEIWDVDEPSTRGIDGQERMRLVRDDIAEKVRDLVDRLNPSP